MHVPSTLTQKFGSEMEDTELLAKLAPGDMIALEARYHLRCLAHVYNRARAADIEDDVETNCDDNFHGIAFAQLVSFMEEVRREESIAPVFRLTDLANSYKTRLEQLGVVVEGRIHTSRLKSRLMSVFPNLSAHSQVNSQGKNVLLTFEGSVGSALRKACDYDNDAMHLARAARVVRKEIFQMKNDFDGSWNQESEHNAVPPSLIALIRMILDGPSIKDQTEIATASTRAALSISQLVVFNSVKNSRNSSSSRHPRERETPLSLYVALKLHASTRERTLVDAFSSLGMCISYDRLLQLTSDIGNGVCERFQSEGVVCPPKMRSDLFTIAAVDNIDHNPSSTTSKESFHGTGISLFQHPTLNSPGQDRGVVVINQSSSAKRIAPLPDEYTRVFPAALKGKEFTVPAIASLVEVTELETFAQARKEEWIWFDVAMEALEKQSLQKNDWISWSAYHASIQEAVLPPAAINALLPLFLDSAHSVAMIKHSMLVVQAAVRHLNAGQVPVLALDQPLYAIAKQIQWTWPATLGEDHFVVMFGGLHIEMTIHFYSKKS